MSEQDCERSFVKFRKQGRRLRMPPPRATTLHVGAKQDQCVIATASRRFRRRATHVMVPAAIVPRI